jgi:hypothetical protein
MSLIIVSVPHPYLARCRRPPVQPGGKNVDETQFNRLARSIGFATSRRVALGGLAAVLLSAFGLGVPPTEARRRHRGRRKNCGAQYAGCNDGSECCEGLVCKQLANPSAAADFTGTCAYRRGCGKRKDYCQKNKDCCRSFRCRGHECKRR